MIDNNRPSLPPFQKTMTSTGMILGIFLAAIESTAVSTSMPTATAALGGLSLIHYIFAAYSFATAVTITNWGKLSDIWGLRKTYIAGCSLFLIASALCGFSQNIYQLIFFRLLQGAGAGAIFPAAMTGLTVIYSETQRSKMQVYLSMIWAIASVAGPPTGAYLTHHLSWRWVFYLNLPAGLISMILVQRGLSGFIQQKEALGRPFDAKGSAILSLIVFLLIAAVSVNRQGRLILGGPYAATTLLGAAVALFLFLKHIKTANDPFISPSVLRNPVFWRTGAGNFFMCMAMFGSIAFVPLFCQAGLGESVSAAGRTLTISLFGWIISSAVAARAYLKFSLRTLCRVGASMMTLSYSFLAFNLKYISVWPFRMGMFSMGLGIGICFAPMMLGLQSTIPRQDLGSGTAALQLLRNLGGLMGITLVGTLLAITWNPHGSILGGVASSGVEYGIREAMAIVFFANVAVSAAGLFAVWGLPAIHPRTEQIGN